MVDVEILHERLRALEGYLATLAVPAAIARDEFVENADVHDLAERRLHLAVECMIDTANHVIAAEGLRTATTYRDVFLVLSEHGVLDASLARRLGGWAGLRNVLVHLYLDIDHGIVHDALTSELGELGEFATSVRDWLHSRE